MMLDVNFAPIGEYCSESELEDWVNLINPDLIFYQNIKKDLLNHKLLTKKKIKTKSINLNCKFEWLPKKKKNLKLYPKQNPLIYIQTSGTTGKSKAIIHDINNLWTSGYHFCKFHNILNSRLRFWNFLTMAYMGGLFNLCLIPLNTEGSIVIDQQFSGKTFLNFWKFIKKYKISCIWVVPTIILGILKLYSKLNEQEILKINKKIKKVFVGMAPLDFKIKEKFEKEFKLKIFDCYGLSETTFISSENSVKKNIRYKNSVGAIFDYLKLEISKKNNTKEIKIKSPFLFRGYLDKYGKVNRNLDDEGFFCTGDLGEKKKNILILTGRNKDVIKKGGYFINLIEIEESTKSFDNKIENVAAVKINDEFYGEDYLLYILIKEKIKSNFKTTIEELVYKNFSKHKLPKKIFFRKNFPETSSGKIKKNLLYKCI